MIYLSAMQQKIFNMDVLCKCYLFVFICSIKPEDVATVRSREILAKLEDLDIILAGLDMQIILVVQ